MAIRHSRADGVKSHRMLMILSMVLLSLRVVRGVPTRLGNLGRKAARQLKQERRLTVGHREFGNLSGHIGIRQGVVEDFK